MIEIPSHQRGNSNPLFFSLINSRPLAQRLFKTGLALVITIASQSIVHRAESASLANGNDTVALITALNKAEFGLFDTNGPLSLKLARFHALNHGVIDDKSQAVLLATLGVTPLKNEQAASRCKSLTNSIFSRNRGIDGLMVREAMWIYARSSPLAKRTGVEHLGTKDIHVQQIKTWMKTNTHGMLGDDRTTQFECNDIYHSKDEAIWATTIYANLKWAKPFQASSTQPENFFSSSSWSNSNPPGRQPTMHCHGMFDFFSDDQIEAVKLPCRQTTTSSLDVVLVVPAKGPCFTRFGSSKVSS